MRFARGKRDDAPVHVHAAGLTCHVWDLPESWAVASNRVASQAGVP